jgi:hypothetical protein
MDMESLIASTKALSWEDPTSQITSLSSKTEPDTCLPLVGHVISLKTQNNQSVFAALSKAWVFAVPFSFAVLGPNKYLFKLSKPEHQSRIIKQVTWNVNGFLIILQQWQPQATLNELTFLTAPFWIQVHGLPLIHMTSHTAISIGKGLGQFVKVDNISGENQTFRSYLRILVVIEVLKPLKPGFSFRREGGEPLWVFLKYERLDIYCTDCGRIGHKKIHCMAPPVEKVPGQYSESLLVNIFSNLLPSPSSARNRSYINPSQTQPSSSQIRPSGSSQPCETSLIPVPNVSSSPAPASPILQQISKPQVKSLHTSPTTSDFSLITSTAKLCLPTTISAPPQPPLLSCSQPQKPVTPQPNTSLESNQIPSDFPTQNYPSLSIDLSIENPHNLSHPATSACTFTQTAITNPTKSPAKKQSTNSKKVNSTKNTLFPPRLLRAALPTPPGNVPSCSKKKRARLSGDLLPHKKISSSSLLNAPDPAELESPIPMDATPQLNLQLPARTFFTASKKKKQVLSSASKSDNVLSVNIENSGDLEESPSCI